MNRYWSYLEVRRSRTLSCIFDGKHRMSIDLRIDRVNIVINQVLNMSLLGNVDKLYSKSASGGSRG
jgi:hypothetical protein